MVSSMNGYPFVTRSWKDSERLFGESLILLKFEKQTQLLTMV